jgi:DNA processing protein
MPQHNPFQADANSDQAELNLQAWLAISLNENFKPAQRRALFPANWLEQPNDGNTQGLNSTLLKQALSTDSATEARIEIALQWQHQGNHHLISITDPRYPALLRSSDSPPLLLYVAGDPKWLNQPSLAIVGSRNASALGLQTAQQFAQELAQLGLTIISGMASGIDSAAHRGALLAYNNSQSELAQFSASSSIKGQPFCASTVAVIGTGIDLCYPEQNRRLDDLIRNNGCVVSEFALGMGPRKHHFPLRNRIIAGLSLGLLVVEAARESGSLITANQALEMGKEIFAIPNSIHSPVGKGCHFLIKNGAHLVEQVQDILNALPKNRFPDSFFAKSMPASVSPTLSPKTSARAANNLSNSTEVTGLHWVGYSPVSVQALVENSGESLSVWFERLCDWELNGLVARTLDGRFFRKN